MNIAFATRKLREICENQVKAERELGVVIAAKLRSRLADLNAARSVKELLFGEPRESSEDGRSVFTINLTQGYQLVLASNHNSIRADGDWAEVTRVKVLEIEADNG